MKLAQALEITPGVTALIGGGGKTTLLYALAQELRQCGRVIVCTSTRIYPPQTLTCVLHADEAQIAAAVSRGEPVCVAATAENGKLKAPEISFDRLRALADFVLVEADGSKGLPLKAHDVHEPVIPPQTEQIICLVGAEGFGKRIRQVAHRPQLYAERLGVSTDTVVTPELAAQFLRLEQLHTRVLVNQCDTPQTRLLARSFAEQMNTPTCMGALQKGWIECLC